MNVDWISSEMEGKPAPVPLLAVQAFANTLDVESSTDSLADAASFARWLEDSGLGVPGIRVSGVHLSWARELREAIRRLLAANERGSADPEATRALVSLASSSTLPLTADTDGNLALDLSPVETPQGLLPLLLGIVFQSQLEGTWPRLKLCENPECLWAFYDHSKNRSGSWCRMGQCGNRLKNRAYRERLKAARG